MIIQVSEEYRMRDEYKVYVDTIPAVADAVELKETFWMNGKQIPGGEKTIKIFQIDKLLIYSS